MIATSAEIVDEVVGTSQCPAREASFRLTLASNSSAGLVHANGWQRSSQPSMNWPILAIRSLTEAKVPRRMAWRVMIGKNASARLSQEQPVGVQRHRGFAASQASTSGCLCAE